MKAQNQFKQKAQNNFEHSNKQPRTNLLGSNLNSLTNALIMMIDDESTTMEVMQSFLEDAGYQNFVLIEDSTQAMAAIEEHKPDLLLLDLIMPNINGFEILAEIRNHPTLSHLPVIILTSSTDAQTKIQALEDGASDFLAKPVDPSELTLRVRNTIAAKAYQDQLAYYDSLTHLPNKSLFLDRLNWSILQADRHNKKLVLLHVFFKNFKQIYDAFGHETGDDVIKQIANRINNCVRDYDLMIHQRDEGDNYTSLFRLGGEEFSILCLEINHPAYAATIATRILEQMKAPFNANGTAINTMPSIGIATYPDDANDMDAFIRASINASYNVNEKNNWNFQFYSENMNTQSYQRLQLETELRQAIANDEFCLYFQPKLDTQSGRIKGAEALIRWEKPDGKIIGPDNFIPLAEETNLIIPIGEWVIRETCKQLAHFQANNVKINLSANISAQQFKSDNLVELFSSLQKEYQIDMRNLTLEITESSLMDNPEKMATTLKQLIDHGLKISLDDFGTGYSSLSYLRAFPLHELKIDRSFVQNMQHNKDDLELVSAIVELARTFNLHVVAEGVEEKDHLNILKKLKCDQYQGYYFSKPVPYQDFIKLLSEYS